MRGPTGAYRTRRSAGITMIEILIAVTLIVLAAMMGVMYVIRAAQRLDHTRDQSFARAKAISILNELKSFVEGGAGEAAADLDGFDDTSVPSPVLTITADPLRPGEFVEPDHPVSGNVSEQGSWRFWRTIAVRPYGTVVSRDLRYITVTVYRVWPGQELPGQQMAEVSTIVRTIGDAFPSTQVYDLYLLALENVPGWWVSMDAIKPFLQAALTDLEMRNPGLSFRTHWITKLGFGRDDEYAPYTNEDRTSTDYTPWAYVYPGRLPQGQAAARYYVPGRMGARVNVDGEDVVLFANAMQAPESYTDDNANGEYDLGEAFVDTDGDLRWSPGNVAPYALADMHNHCKRYPEALALEAARVTAGTDDAGEPTWRLLLDRMATDPEKYHNAMLVNLHGELLPMPPARNVSDPAKDPEQRPGWRVVTHPERIRPRRVEGDDVLSEAPRFRVYAYKSEFLDDEVLTSLEEPLVDTNGSGVWDAGEAFEDWNGNGVWDAGTPISLVLRDADLSARPNDPAAPTLRILGLAGGIDADGNGTPDPYEDWRDATILPESFGDTNGDGRRQRGEVFLDLDGDGARSAFEPWAERDGDGVFTLSSETLADVNGNDRFDAARPAEPFTDANGDGQWTPAEPYADLDGNGTWTPPTAPVLPWVPWSPSAWGNTTATATYVAAYGEPFLDQDGDGHWDDAESFVDTDANGVCDGGFARGEMFVEVLALPDDGGTLVRLHGTPLETPFVAATGRGLPVSRRLYDLDYVPCPTPDTADGVDRFARDLHHAAADVPKNTARWILEIPLPALRTAFESSAGAADGDAADRLLTVETRFGRDLATGQMWPVRVDPANLSTTYAWFYENAEDLPPSERYQFLGDPRHSPYADTDARGTTAPHGYNWYFDDFRDATGDATGDWLAFDASRLADGWLARGSSDDVPRLMGWLRDALCRCDAVYTTLTGFSYYYLSVGGDVGSDADNGFPNSIPMDGAPFGMSGLVYENTITDGGGSSEIKGSRKHVVSTVGADSDVRLGGRWWSKPWLGELCSDTSYASQWKPMGNLRAGPIAATGVHRLARRGDLPAAQQPRGTTLPNRYARLAAEGCTVLFHTGTSNQTFHHLPASGGLGSLVEDGLAMGPTYDFHVPDPTLISRPFGLRLSGSGGVGPEFERTDVYPRYETSLVARFYDHDNGQTGSGLVLLREPTPATGGSWVLVNGLDRTLETGSAFLARYSMLSLLHSFLAAGAPDVPKRIRLLPRVQIQYPVLTTELENPASITVRWSTQWRRWDGRAYTEEHGDSFQEDEADLYYVLYVSRDHGRSWTHLQTGEDAEIGVLPRLPDGSPDPLRTIQDFTIGGDEAYEWATPSDDVPEGAYMLRVEAWRASEFLHYAQHVERIYVLR